MTTVNEVFEAVKHLVPDSTAVHVAEAVAKTVADPGILNIAADLELAHTLYHEFIEKINGLHPSVSTLFKKFF